tara:strand:+ start:3954 stop:4934 length:981 start_codon:yes stop_codon:yes gene_type:complete
MKALINIYSNIQCVENNHSGLESVYLSKTYNMDLIGKAGRTNKNFEKFKDIFETKSLNCYDKVIIQLSQPNFFGGVIGDDTIEKIRKMANYENDLAILCTDPRIKPTNPAVKINERQADTFTEDEVLNWEEHLHRATYLFPGNDLAKFWNDEKYKTVKVSKFDFFGKIFGKLLEPAIDELIPKRHDVVYYGDRRGSHREKLVQQYMPQNAKSLLIGYKTNKVDVPYTKKLKHADLMHKLDQCKVSLVLGDAEHENNVITFRLYETLASNCLAAIPIQYDRDMTIIKDPELRKLLYVRSKQDVRNLVNAYSNELIKKQHEEFKRLTS